MTTLSFILRIAAAWFFGFLAVLGLGSALFDSGDPNWFFALLWISGVVIAAVSAFSHLRRVRLVAGRVDASTLANRQRREIEMPLDGDEAFAIVDAAIRELPRTEDVETARDSLQVRAKVQRLEVYGQGVPERFNPLARLGSRRNQIWATVTPGDGASRVTVVCEPERGAWSDWFLVDDGVNLENAEAITRAISRRLVERRRQGESAARQSDTEKELTVAKLSLLHAQVEPHFLYNTLASAQLLTRADPPRADEMLGHLIVYLRHSLPRTENAPSSLGEELARARAYLEILKIRMGPRLNLQIDVPDHLYAEPFPPMMLQTLVENAIKHGLESQPGGGTVWILARRSDDGLSVTVADDGQGFNTDNSGTGIGLKNVRERLRLAYGPSASFDLVANYPSGVAATIRLPGASTDGSSAAPNENRDHA
ncbi:MAG: sensor histidine kinase [Arenimonas sp.]